MALVSSTILTGLKSFWVCGWEKPCTTCTWLNSFMIEIIERWIVMDLHNVMDCYSSAGVPSLLLLFPTSLLLALSLSSKYSEPACEWRVLPYWTPSWPSHDVVPSKVLPTSIYYSFFFHASYNFLSLVFSVRPKEKEASIQFVPVILENFFSLLGT